MERRRRQVVTHALSGSFPIPRSAASGKRALDDIDPLNLERLAVDPIKQRPLGISPSRPLSRQHAVGGLGLADPGLRRDPCTARRSLVPIGGVAEWLIAAVFKTVRGAPQKPPPWVRIPPPPPLAPPISIRLLQNRRYCQAISTHSTSKHSCKYRCAHLCETNCGRPQVMNQSPASVASTSSTACA